MIRKLYTRLADVAGGVVSWHVWRFYFEALPLPLTSAVVVVGLGYTVE